MKLSIITVTYNSEKTLSDTLNSVLSQTYSNIEHIFVDGGSKDNTIKLLNKYPNPRKKIYVKKGYGIYKSINYGIKKSKGKYIAILNSDDIYESNSIISEIISTIKKSKNNKIILGNLTFFKNFNYTKIIRYYNIKNFNIDLMKYAVMPAHPASIIHKDVYKKYGLYSENYYIASDFEFFLKILFIKKIPFKIFNKNIVRMRVGGISTSSFRSYFLTSNEIYKIYLFNKINTNYLKIFLRIPLKLKQFVFNKYDLNKQFKNYTVKFNKKYIYNNSFKIIENVNSLIIKKRFILSGLNLAYLGYFGINKLNLNYDLYHWIDGIWAKKHINLDKKPGRQILNELVLPKQIKRITVIGNMTDKSKKYLIKKFKLKIEHVKLPYLEIEELIRKKINIINPSETLILITLPTPKQEQFADFLSQKLKSFKIICIGASLSIASGEEKTVPKFLRDFEFLWRLKTDPFRRIYRLLSTFYFYTKNKLIYNKYNQIRFLKID